MAEGTQGNGYVDPASVAAPAAMTAALPELPQYGVDAADRARDLIALVQGAERAAARRFTYPFVRLVADEA